MLEAPLPQWLGRVSYPLYLSHWVILYYAPGPLILRVAACFVAAEALAVTVERWSVAGSRHLSKIWPRVVGVGAK
jgi:peptidoglycan/LPS O-acetylase OafA/YrhL